MDFELNPLKWHALYVASRCEHKVSQQLTALGYENCVPVQKQLKNWSDRKKLVEVILFPSYVFLATDARRLQDPLNLPNVINYVKFGDEIATLSKKEVELIKTIGNCSHPVEIRSDKLLPGEEVEIISGPLKNHFGRVLSVNGTAYLQLAIPSLKCFAQVVVGKGEVRRVGD